MVVLLLLLAVPLAAQKDFFEPALAQPSQKVEVLVQNLQREYVRSLLAKQTPRDFESLVPAVGEGGKPPSAREDKPMYACVATLDMPCILDHVESFVDRKNKRLLKQADEEARKLPHGRGSGDDEDATPSGLIQSIAQLVFDIPELLKESIVGMLRSGKLDGAEDDDDEDDDENTKDDNEDDGKTKGDRQDEDDDKQDFGEDEEDEDRPDDGDEEEERQAEKEDMAEARMGEPRRKCRAPGCHQNNQDDRHGRAGSSVGASRGKKKKKKRAIIKLMLLGLVLKAKITLLLKLLAAKLQIKFLIIAIASLFINIARFWWDLKKGHHEPQKVIYYEHAQHQHHYEDNNDWHSSPGGSYWARSYDEEDDAKGAQDLAYAKQAPKGTYYSRVDDKPNISWNPWG